MINLNFEMIGYTLIKSSEKDCSSLKILNFISKI